MCDGTCVPLTFLCDGVKDCQDNNDELNCNYFPELWFTARREFLLKTFNYYHRCYTGYNVTI